MSTVNADLREKIDEAKRRMTLPEMMRQLGIDEKHIGKSAYCLFHEDEHKSFSVWQGKHGWQWRCFAACGHGDEIALLVKHFNITYREAITRYLDMAGFPATRCSKSREYPASPVPPVCPMSPVSEGQSIDAEVKRITVSLGAHNACTAASDVVHKKCFKYARELKSIEQVLGRKHTPEELSLGFDEWYRLSQPFLDAAKSREDYLTNFLAQFPKIRFATGEGTLPTALEKVLKLSSDKLPMIPGYGNAPETYRRILALHLEIYRIVGGNGKTYFLDYRSAAKTRPGMSAQKAHDITHALETLGAIKIVSKGAAGLNSGKAAKFRYFLAE